MNRLASRPRFLRAVPVLALFVGLGGSALLFGQAKAPPAPLDKDHAAKMAKGLDVFKRDVRTVLVQKCLKCHGGERTESEFDLTDRDRLLKGGNLGPAIVPGDSKKSLLYLNVAHLKEPHMPHERAKLPATAIARIAEWIDLGAPYDKPLVARDDASAWTKKTIAPDARQHWAFLPLKRVKPPQVHDESWVKTPVDRFILAKLDEKGIKPNPEASKRLLVRRAYFGLVGLPPTPEEVEAFLKDDRPDAYEKLIDKLLTSPHFGERWARHWLDLARFAESHGFEHDYDRPSAYHYRDFVIKAFNDDLPFDTFVKWQLAGDEVAPDNNLALMATGFLAAGVHSTQITKNEVEKHRYDELDDMLNTTGTAFLGLTFGCARCHDHKFDPIPSADYYRMLSTFTTTVRSEVELNLDPEGYKKAKAAYDAEHAPFEAALKKFDAEQLPARFAAWEKQQAGKPVSPGWVLAELKEMKSAGGATLTKQDDGSVLVSGKNPTIETLTFTAPTDLTGITAFRIEALAHPSLVKGGPGRAGNGNFALTDFRVTATPKKGGKAVAVKLRNPRATFEQKGLAVAGAIDADPVTSGWAVDPQFGKDHAAAFEAETPVGFEGGTVLAFTLKFQNNVGHGMGRPRLSLTTSKSPLDLKGSGMAGEVARLLGTPAAKRSPAETAALLKWYRTLDPEWQKLDKAARDHAAKAPKPALVKALVSTEGLPAVRLHTQGADFFPETYFLKRGDPAQKEGVAPAGFLQLLAPADAGKRWHADPPKGSRLSYRRTAFADWMTDADDGAGRLLARVIVNRLWQHHMGRGIIATPSDFGTRGTPPTHPELLDYLAGELIKNGWRLKPIHKLIMMSAVYRQGPESDEARRKVDRENALFWRKPVQRLEAEVIRDSLLAVGGALDAKMFGPGTLDDGSRRRSVYFTMKRSKLIPMLVIFDAPDGTVGVGERPTTTIAPQALLLMNNAHVRSWAKGFARRAAPDDRRPPADVVKSAYRIALSREPSAGELADGVSFLAKQTTSYAAEQKPNARELAVTDFCQVLLCLNEFVYVE